MQRPAGDALASAWAQADKALGGWLPGGGTPNALTRGYDKPTGRVANLARSAGVDPNSFKVANLSRRRPIENQAAVAAEQAGLTSWGHAAYGGTHPLHGPVVGLYGNESDRVIIHELGHAVDPRPTPDGGRALQAVSQAFGNPPAGRVLAAAGLALDAAGEDHAERFTSRHFGDGLGANKEDPQAYGNALRTEAGKELREAALGAVGMTPLVRRAAASMGSRALGAANQALDLASQATRPMAAQAFENSFSADGSLRPDADPMRDPGYWANDRLSKLQAAVKAQQAQLRLYSAGE